MNNRSFIDLLFILLCGTIVLLSRSVTVGQIETAPARVGGEGVSEIHADQVVLVAVGPDRLEWVDRAGRSHECERAEDVHAAIAADHSVLLVAAGEQVSHQRVMQVWGWFRRLGRTVKLGAEPAERGGA